MSYDLILCQFNIVGAGTDMEGHMGTLKTYASQCSRIIEFGVYDCTSTWALLAGRPAWMRSYDVIRRPEVDQVENAVADSGIDFRFVLGSTLDVTIEETDLLFIDSLHTYDHLSQELALHSGKVRKFIVLHDTTTFAEIDENYQGKGLWPAIEEFLAKGVWKIKECFTNCNGLTVLER